MDYEISPNNIQLKSSFEVRKEDFERELSAIRAQHPDSLVWNRSMDSLKREWAVHNAFHLHVGFFEVTDLVMNTVGNENNREALRELLPDKRGKKSN